jgi:hypothetical protein
MACMTVVGSMSNLVAIVVLALSLATCSAPPSAPTFAIAGRAVAGPTCPVEPADPMPGQCDPRPVAGATLIVTDGTGHEVVRLTTGQDGGFAASLPAGSYTLTPQPVTGLMGGAQPIEFTVSATDPQADLAVAYDTGIR